MAPPPCSDGAAFGADRPASRAGRAGSAGSAPRGSAAACARISALACAISSADMSSKSLCCRTSLAEKVSVASSSILGARRRPAPRPRPAASAAPSASARRRATSCRRRLGRLDLRQQQLHRLLEQVGLAPEDVERLVEQLALVAPVDEHRVQGPVEVGAAAAARPPRPRGSHPAPCRGRPACRRARSARAKCMMLVANRPGSKRLRSGGADGVACVMSVLRAPRPTSEGEQARALQATSSSPITQGSSSAAACHSR